MQYESQEEFDEEQRRQEELRKECEYLVTDLMERVTPLKQHLREFMAIEDLPEPLFRVTNKVWNSLDRAQETVKKELA